MLYALRKAISALRRLARSGAVGGFIASAAEVRVGSLTNTNEFYQLTIRQVFQ